MLLGNNLEILTSYFPFILQTSARYLMVIPPCLCTILFLPSETRSSCYAECKICKFIIMKSLKKLRLLCWTCTQCWTIGCSSPNTLLVPVGQRNEEQRNWGRGYILDAVDFVCDTKSQVDEHHDDQDRPYWQGVPYESEEPDGSKPGSDCKVQAPIWAGSRAEQWQVGKFL